MSCLRSGGGGIGRVRIRRLGNLVLRRSSSCHLHIKLELGRFEFRGDSCWRDIHFSASMFQDMNVAAS